MSFYFLFVESSPTKLAHPRVICDHTAATTIVIGSVSLVLNLALSVCMALIRIREAL